MIQHPPLDRDSPLSLRRQTYLSAKEVVDAAPPLVNSMGRIARRGGPSLATINSQLCAEPSTAFSMDLMNTNCKQQTLHS